MNRNCWRILQLILIDALKLITTNRNQGFEPIKKKRLQNFLGTEIYIHAFKDFFFVMKL